MNDDLKVGDVIEVHEQYLQGPIDGPCVYFDQWCAATILAVYKIRIDALLLNGERKGMRVTLEPHRRNQTWRG